MARFSFAGRYAVAALFTVVALALVSVGHSSWDVSAAYSFLLAAVMLSSWLGGLGPGLLSTFLGTLLADFFFIAPVDSITVDATRLLQISAFVLVAIFISSLNGSRRRATAALEAERTRLEETVQSRTADLTRADRNLRGLIESAPDAIVAIDTAGRIVKVNSEAERLFGYPREGLLGADVETIVPEWFRRGHREARESDGDKPVIRTIDGELFGRRSDGSAFPIDVRVSALESEDGMLNVGVIRDGSERHRLQRVQQQLVHDLGERVKELTALHSVARVLNESAPTSDLLARIVMLLPAAWQYPDITAARIVIGELEARTPAFDRTKWLQRAQFAAPDGQVGVIDVVYLEERPLASEGPFLAEERSLIDSLAGLLQSFFERRHAEDDRLRLARAEASALEAQAANRTKDQFLATLSHELRAPLSVMLGWTRMLRAGHLDATAATQGLDVLDRSVRLQAKLIDDLLDVSRIVTGKLRLDRQRVDLGSVATAAVDAIGPAAHARNIEITAAVDPSVWLDADPARLQQIISNLLSNALKFTGAGGSVAVHVSRGTTAARLVIGDTGIGMSPDLVPLVFERFRQGEQPTTASNRGLGLGLSIVKRLVELHGGTIEASSPGIGQGSTFTITLPLAPDAGPVHDADIALPSRSLTP